MGVVNFNTTPIIQRINMNNLSWEKTKSILIFLFIAVILWIAFGPVQLGGQTAYVILNGNSMAPDFKIGDLVVARKSLFYEVNQRVVYDNPKIGYVFHRIIDWENNEYIFKGR